MTDVVRDVSVRFAVEQSLTEARLGDLDAAAVAVLRTLADKIDQEADLRDAFIAWSEEREMDPPRLPKEDNVSIPTFLKYCDALGLTPAARAARAVKEGKKQEAGGDIPQTGLAARRRAVSNLRTA